VKVRGAFPRTIDVKNINLEIKENYIKTKIKNVFFNFKKHVKTYISKIMFIRTQSLSNAFRWFTVYGRINVISELFKLVEKI